MRNAKPPLFDQRRFIILIGLWANVGGWCQVDGWFSVSYIVFIVLVLVIVFCVCLEGGGQFQDAVSLRTGCYW